MDIYKSLKEALVLKIKIKHEFILLNFDFPSH